MPSAGCRYLRNGLIRQATQSPEYAVGATPYKDSGWLFSRTCLCLEKRLPLTRTYLNYY